MSICTHESTRTIAEGCYTGSVAVYPYTAENRAAHGCVVVTVECCACGAQRAENRNGCHLEVGTWGPTRREREAEERRQAERRERERAAAAQDAERAQAAYDAAMVRACGVLRARAVWRTDRDGRFRDQEIEVVYADHRTIVPLREVRRAAEQEDTGDGLVPFYRGLLAEALR